MAEGLIPTREWIQLRQKQTAGREAEAFQELDGTMLYQESKALMLESLGYTCVKARQTVWRNQRSDHQSQRAHLTPIIRGINRLTNNLKDTKEFMMEMFQGVLTLYYSAEVCHSLRGKGSTTCNTSWMTWKQLGNPDHTQSVPRYTGLQSKGRSTTGDSSGPDLEMHILQREALVLMYG